MVAMGRYLLEVGVTQEDEVYGACHGGVFFGKTAPETNTELQF